MVGFLGVEVSSMKYGFLFRFSRFFVPDFVFDDLRFYFFSEVFSSLFSVMGYNGIPYLVNWEDDFFFCDFTHLFDFFDFFDFLDFLFFCYFISL